MDKIKTTPKDFFLQLGVMAALYVSAVSLINLLFQTIDYAFPDALAYYGDPYSGGIRIAIASLVIIFPLFIFLSRLNGKDFATWPEKRELPIRRWLIYLTLFVAGIAVVVDLIALVNTFLSGEITTRFALKILSVLVVAGGVFGYFMYDLKKSGAPASSAGKRQDKLFAWIAAAVVLVSIVGGFLIMGSPATARAQKMDAQRITDLQNIQWQVVSYWQQKEKMPKTLIDLADQLGGWQAPTDPQTSAVYEYVFEKGMTFQLCANFSRNNLGESEKLKGRGSYGRGDYSIAYPTAPVYDGVGGVTTDNWEHANGRVCFSRTIDPDKYPPIKKISY